MVVAVVLMVGVVHNQGDVNVTAMMMACFDGEGSIDSNCNGACYEQWRDGPAFQQQQQHAGFCCGFSSYDDGSNDRNIVDDDDDDVNDDDGDELMMIKNEMKMMVVMTVMQMVVVDDTGIRSIAKDTDDRMD